MGLHPWDARDIDTYLLSEDQGLERSRRLRELRRARSERLWFWFALLGWAACVVLAVSLIH